jgi:hypothetical protein
MMRRPLTTLTLVATCGLLALGAIVLVSGQSAGSETPRAREAGAAMRTWQLSMSAAPGDLALAEISFANADRTRLERRSLQVAVSGPLGDDYLATAVLHPATKRGPAALVLLVNRPSPLLDPAVVALRVSSQRSLGAPTVRRLTNPFARPTGATVPALCDLQRHGALSPSSLGVLATRGPTLTGFGAASAIAQAYDVACGLPHESSFTQAVERSGAPGQEAPTPAEPVSPTPPAPTPTPPVGKIPGEGCQPAPGRACPGAVTGAAPRAAAGAH